MKRCSVTIQQEGHWPPIVDCDPKDRRSLPHLKNRPRHHPDRNGPQSRLHQILHLVGQQDGEVSFHRCVVLIGHPPRVSIRLGIRFVIENHPRFQGTVGFQ